jgi:autotransporter-associated beta strand protein
MGGSLDVLGIQITTVNNSSGRISGTGGQTLTIGAGGIDAGSGNTNTFRIDPAIILSANQTWSVSSGRILNLVAAGMSGAYTARVTGAGSLAFDASGTATYGSQLEVDSTILRINFATSDVTFTNVNNSFTTLSLFNGTGRFSSIADSGLDSAAGAFTTATIGGNGTNGLFVYTGSSASTNRSFTRDARSATSGIEVSTAEQTLTISGALGSGSQVNTSSNGWVFAGAGNLILNGIISNSTGVGSTGTTITKNGAGTLTLGGNNTFTGSVTVNAGTLAISANERIANTNNLTLAGGTFDVGTFTETLGTLDLTSAGGTINLGSSGQLIFADSSALDWNGGLLSISGTFTSGSSIRFGSGSSALSGTQISSITIAGFTGVGLDSSGFLTASAIPEPSTFAALAGFGVLGFAAMRRRRAS